MAHAVIFRQLDYFYPSSCIPKDIIGFILSSKLTAKPVMRTADPRARIGLAPKAYNMGVARCAAVKVEEGAHRLGMRRGNVWKVSVTPLSSVIEIWPGIHFGPSVLLYGFKNLPPPPPGQATGFSP